VLLSLAVFPGLGQAVTGRPWRALFYAGASLALLGRLLHRVYLETTRLLPSDPEATLDLGLPFRLAAEVHRANASFFFWTTAGIVLLCALSGLDAWAATRRVPRATRPGGAAPGKP